MKRWDLRLLLLLPLLIEGYIVVIGHVIVMKVHLVRVKEWRCPEAVVVIERPSSYQMRACGCAEVS